MYLNQKMHRKSNADKTLKASKRKDPVRTQPWSTIVVAEMKVQDQFSQVFQLGQPSREGIFLWVAFFR